MKFQSHLAYASNLNCNCFCSQKGHFKGMLFHRVIKHYVIQAGDNQGTGATEDWNLRGKQHTRFSNSFGFCYLKFFICIRKRFN